MFVSLSVVHRFLQSSNAQISTLGLVQSPTGTLLKNTLAGLSPNSGSQLHLWGEGPFPTLKLSKKPVS